MRSNAADSREGKRISARSSDPPAPAQVQKKQSPSMSVSPGHEQSSASGERSSGDIRQSSYTQRDGAPLQTTRILVQGTPGSENTSSKDSSSRLALQTLPFSLNSMPSPATTRESPRLTLITRQLLSGSKIPSIVTGSSSAHLGSGSQLMSSIPTTLHSIDSNKTGSRFSSAQPLNVKSSAASPPSGQAVQRPRASRAQSPAASAAKHKQTAAAKDSNTNQVKTPDRVQSSREASRSRARRRGGQFTTMRFVLLHRACYGLRPACPKQTLLNLT